jgi:hypothetical protein
MEEKLRNGQSLSVVVHLRCLTADHFTVVSFCFPHADFFFFFCEPLSPSATRALTNLFSKASR